MKKLFAPFNLIFVLALLFVGCSEEVQEKIRVSKEFAPYVSGYTSGVINKNQPIQIQFAQEIENIDLNDNADPSLFEIVPEVEGDLIWVNNNTIEFKPKDGFSSGKDYTVHFDLGKVMEVPDELKTFSFNFSVVQQNFTVYIEGLDTYSYEDLSRQRLNGKILLADRADTSSIRKTLRAFQEGKELVVNWNFYNPIVPEFTVENIERDTKSSQIELQWDGSPIDVDEKYEEKVKVPAIGEFYVANMEVIHEPEQFVKIHFTDPLASYQNLNGLISIDNISNLNFQIEGHDIRVYLPYRLTGNHAVSVSAGIKNILGFKMQEADEIELVFEGIKPQVKLVGEGVIIPNTEKGYLFPFEAVNLKAVDVFVTKVYQNNIIQFFQVNSLNGNDQMKRVSAQVMQKRIDLNQGKDVNLHEWNRFQVDLSNIISMDPGAIYQIELKFRQEYSAYLCGEEEQSIVLTSIETNEEDDWNENGWDSYDYWYDYDYWDYEDDYDYRENKNPCNSSYYRYKSVKSNVLASDIGVIAKAGGDKTIHVFINDIKTTQPISGATVEFYDFQQQLIGSINTDSEGMASLKLNKKPFLIITKNGEQRGYLKLRDGEALSVSKFEVSGKTVQKGIKGFIYAERGVWRPGDSIYLSFMLEDKNNVLPNNHPVTFTLTNPQGNIVDKKVTSKNVNGLYDFRTATLQEDITGNYLATVSVGNRSFSKYLKVETVKPNRLKIYLDFANEILKRNDDNRANLSVKWLHGAIAKNLKAKVELTVNQKHTAFPKYEGYSFENPITDFETEDQVVFEGRVDENGEASFNANVYIGDAAPGMLTANFVTKFFEEGGGFSIDRKAVSYSPYSRYAGIKVPKGNLYRGTLVTDEPHYIDIASVDENGKPVSSEVDVKVYKIEWRWWWDSYDNDLASYISKSSTVPVYEKTISTKNGKGGFNFQINRPEWGRYIILAEDKNSGHIAGKIVYVDWPYWARSERTSSENATMLSFSTDKEKYNVGESVKISFPSSAEGRAIIALENGTKVLKKYEIETTKGETKFEIETTKDMAPNVFVHITLLQPHEVSLNDLPIRMYGVAPIVVENQDSHLHPVIKMKDVIQPETTESITISEKDGKPMTYTLAIVDEGLLDLTGFKTPNPWDEFYAKEALGVKTWDMYDQVMGAYATEMNKLLAIGGDGSGKLKKPNKANRFEPMVRFVGPFALDPGKSMTHNIDIPNYVGSVRVMVVAGQDERYGNAEKTVPVRSPLMVLGTLPRVLSPTETVYLPVNVFAMENHVKNVSVSVSTNEMLKIVGSKQKSIQFAKPGDEVINFELEVVEKIGVATVEIIAKSGSEVAKYNVELDVRTPNPRVVDTYEMTINPGESWSPEVAFTGIEGTNSATIELSAFPSINLNDRLKYLIRYPHGCIEQTTSSVFPQLALGNVMNLSNDYKLTIAKNIKAGVERLRLFQTSDGGFSYWPGQTESNEWGTTYAGNFIIEAETIGFKLPAGMKSKWQSYQRNKARQYVPGSKTNYYRTSYYDDLNQAYRLYTLALSGSAEVGAMNRLREYSKLNLPAKWRLAAAYQLIGQPEVATELIYGLTTDVPAYQELSYSYGSNYRDEAMILETLVLMGNKSEAAGLAKIIADKLNSNNWMSTQTTAYSLLAISKFLGSSTTDKTMRFEYTVDGGNPVSKSTQVPVYQNTLKINQKGIVRVVNNGKGVLYAKVAVEGIPVVGDQTSASSNLVMNVRYTNMNGREIIPDRMEQGTDFIAEVTVKNPGTRGLLDNMALNQLFPSGWEIHNARMDNFSSTIKNSSFDYQDIRDDRVYTYFSLSNGETKTYRIKLNATYLGKFYLPTVETEAMYDNTVSARKAGYWVEVVLPESMTSTQ